MKNISFETAFSVTVCGLFALLSFTPTAAFASEFSDVSSDDPLSAVVTELKNRNVINGYEDGTFRPNNKVNRAEALKIVVAPLVSAEDLKDFSTTPYSDIQDGDWYLPYTEYARTELGIIDGPPSKTAFHGTDAVKKVEFIKMLLLANNVSPDSYSEIKMPLSNDVTNPDEWYYPYFRYAYSASMLQINDQGLLSPGEELTRGDTATLLFYFLMYKENRRTQALLSEADVELSNVVTAIGENNIVQAEYAVARALLTARGAHSSRPEATVTKGALKITQAYVALVQAYRAGLNLQFESVVEIAGDAYRLAEEAVSINPDAFTAMAEKVKDDAKSLADEARGLMQN